MSGDLPGYLQGDLASARDLLDPLLDIFQIDVIEDGPVLRFRSRARASLPPICIDAVVDEEDRPLWQETRGHDSDFAAEAIVTFYDPLNDYEQASVRSRRAPSASSRVLRYDLGAVLPEETALATAEAQLRDNRISRRSLTFSLSPSEVSVQPGDVLSMGEGPEGSFLVTRIEDGAARLVEAREFAPDVGGTTGNIAGSFAAGNRMAAAIYAPLVALMDLPRYTAGEATDFARGAVFARPWRTTVLLSSPSSEAYEIRTRLDRPAQIGALAAPLAPGVAFGRFDWSQVLEVDLAQGGLTSAPELLVLNGANLFALQGAGGQWEVGAFLQAEEIAPGRWRLAGLLRGLYGTDDVAAAEIVTGAVFVMLDVAVRPLALTAGEIGLQLNWLAEAASTAESIGPFAFAGGLRAETPLAPVHIAGIRNADGDIALTWIRRGRIDADSWQPADIPMDEPAERYRVDILHDDTLMRSLEVDAPACIYPSSDEIADFGAVQSQLKVGISQLGQRVAAGIPAISVITF